MKTIYLTGDRPTGKLHLGHFVGSLKNRVTLQNEPAAQQYIMIADQQALTDNADNPEKIQKSVKDVLLDYLSVGLDPKKSTLFIQSKIPELAELTMYYLNIVSVARLNRNPTVKNEIKEKGFAEHIPAGFLIYPISQAADITAFKTTHVAAGGDQRPMLEQTREIVRSFNQIYNTSVLIEPEIILPPKNQERLMGLDGKAKMSKSLNNAIFLADDENTVKSKVMKMYTDPDHIHVNDPGNISNNVVFKYLDVFATDKDTVGKMKEHYQHGGLGDVVIKRYLINVLEELLCPIRKKRAYFANQPDYLIDVLKQGSTYAEKQASITLDEVKNAMGITYF